ncbi:MAG: DsbA family protein [Actinomycetota bacterium]|nr:DsbA family protein [Actinomycetota bacterium]MDQ6946261.1 DsbA family protein [Actinomycetota bacterium]
MTDVEFFFDPSCPWTWITSRWLATVAPERQLAVTWRTWSLAIKNEGKELPPNVPAEWRERILAGRAFSTGALRVLEAAGAQESDESRGRLYTEMGRRYHGEGDRGEGGPDGDVMAAALAAAGLPTELAEAAGEERWDEAIRDNMDEVGREIGDEVGVPIVAIRGGGRLRAMSGPIMAEVPTLERAVALWDAVATVITEPAIFELKRHRTASPDLPALDADGRAAYPPSSGQR